MKISIEEIDANEEEEIIIRCRQVDQEILELYHQIKQNKNCIAATCNEEIYRLPARYIFYFETVDNKAFFYCMDKVYETKRNMLAEEINKRIEERKG